MIKIDTRKCFMLFACCIPVKGVARSIIYDLQRGGFLYIPNDIYDFLKNESAISGIANNNDETEILELLHYLAEQEYGFFTSEPENFPAIDFANNDFPDVIKNCIVDFDKNSKHNLTKIINQLSEVHCSAIELRFFYEIPTSDVENYLDMFEKSTMRTINLVLKFSELTSETNLFCLQSKYKRISKIFVYSTPKSEVTKIDKFSKVYFVSEDIHSSDCCGNISPYYFTSNIDFFKEALASNTCLNKKVAIDVLGNIKNCPSMPISFGNITDTNIMSCVDSNEFQKLWKIKKDDIDTCKICEYRYMCHDCRAFLSSENLYNKPKKCNYDPHTNLWN
jgi:SPASM domain peptide maturase of grasp-with-spasm system